jgi:methyltransferase
MLTITRVIFVSIVAAVLIQRWVELRISQRHVMALLAQGGRLHGSNLIGIVKGLQIAWFVAMIAEVWGLNRPFMPLLAAIAILATIAGQSLRYLSMRALGQRWTLPIVTLPGASAIDTGIYRYLRHPNWLGVILEILALPLIHGAYLTAICFSIANAILIIWRIKAEEKALSQDNNYAQVLAMQPRLIPNWRGIRIPIKNISS